MTTAERLITKLLAGSRPRAGSLAITVFGDCVAQHGGSVWLGSLVSCLEHFGLNAQQCRTAIFRLGQDDWIESERRGRRRFCRLSSEGHRQYERAARRIYAAATPDWNGEWTLLMPSGIDADQRDVLRRRLGWLGFANFPNGLLAHPCPDASAVSLTIAELGLSEQVVVWEAKSDDIAVLREQVSASWALNDLSLRYRDFKTRFEDILDRRDSAQLSGRDAFVIRTLLIHEYRRLILKTVDLPADLLPAEWPGFETRTLVNRLYGKLAQSSSQWAADHLLGVDGPLGPPRSEFAARFGGIGRDFYPQAVA